MMPVAPSLSGLAVLACTARKLTLDAVAILVRVLLFPADMMFERVPGGPRVRRALGLVAFATTAAAWFVWWQVAAALAAAMSKAGVASGLVWLFNAMMTAIGLWFWWAIPHAMAFAIFAALLVGMVVRWSAKALGAHVRRTRASCALAAE